MHVHVCIIFQEAYQSLKVKLQAARTEVESGAAQVRECLEREAQLTQQVQHLEVVKGALAQDIEQLRLQYQHKEAEVSHSALGIL